MLLQCALTAHHIVCAKVALERCRCVVRAPALTIVCVRELLTVFCATNNNVVNVSVYVPCVYVCVRMLPVIPLKFSKEKVGQVRTPVHCSTARNTIENTRHLLK